MGDEAIKFDFYQLARKNVIASTFQCAHGLCTAYPQSPYSNLPKASGKDLLKSVDCLCSDGSSPGTTNNRFLRGTGRGVSLGGGGLRSGSRGIE